MILAALVTVIFHLPINTNAGVPFPPASIATAEHRIAAYGPSVVRRGTGSYMNARGVLEIEPDDHVWVRVPRARVAGLLATELRWQHAHFDQDSFLAEVYDTTAVAPGLRRAVSLRVDLPKTCACPVRVRRLLALFAKTAGGASEATLPTGDELWSDVDPARVTATLAALRRSGEHSRSWPVLIEFYPGT